MRCFHTVCSREHDPCQCHGTSHLKWTDGTDGKSQAILCRGFLHIKPKWDPQVELRFVDQRGPCASEDHPPPGLVDSWFVGLGYISRVSFPQSKLDLGSPSAVWASLLAPLSLTSPRHFLYQSGLSQHGETPSDFKLI